MNSESKIPHQNPALKRDITHSESGTSIHGPAGMGFFHLLQLKGALKMEMLGMKHRQGSVYAYVKKHFGFRGNKRKVRDQLITFIEAVKAGEQEYNGAGGFESGFPKDVSR